MVDKNSLRQEFANQAGSPEVDTRRPEIPGNYKNTSLVVVIDQQGGNQQEGPAQLPDLPVELPDWDMDIFSWVGYSGYDEMQQDFWCNLPWKIRQWFYNCLQFLMEYYL